MNAIYIKQAIKNLGSCRNWYMNYYVNTFEKAGLQLANIWISFTSRRDWYHGAITMSERIKFKKIYMKLKLGKYCLLLWYFSFQKILLKEQSPRTSKTRGDQLWKTLQRTSYWDLNKWIASSLSLLLLKFFYINFFYLDDKRGSFHLLQANMISIKPIIMK